MIRFLSFSLLVTALLVAGCSSARKATTSTGTTKEVMAEKSVAGTWSALVAGTPAGDVPFDMILTKEGEAYKGYVQANGQRMDLQNLKVEASKITCSFYSNEYGTDITMDINWKSDTDTLEGWVMDSFRLTGKRKAEVK